MASMFTARRKPKRIVDRDDVHAGHGQHTTNDADVEDSGSLLRKPSKAPKAKSGLRIAAVPDEEAGSPSVVVQRPSRPSRINSNALAQSIFQRQRERNEEDDRPSYSRSHLDQLRNSTPTTPRDLSQHASSAEDDPLPQDQPLNVISKFGPEALSSSLQPSIPSSMQIAEAKSRRARLAVQEQAAPGDGFVSLEDYDSDGEFKPQRMQIGLYAHGRKGDSGAYEKEHTRLIREDEDIAEGFDEFVEDEGSNRVLMGRKGVRDLERKEKEKVRAIIDAAEGGSDQDGAHEDDDSDSDASLRHAYETAQTSHGLAYDSSSRKKQERQARRPRQPEKTTPTPSLNEGLMRIRALVEQADLGKQRLELRKAEILRRQQEIEVEKERIQSGLKELGDQLERSKLNGIGHGSAANPRAAGGVGTGSRGLDNIGQV